MEDKQEMMTNQRRTKDKWKIKGKIGRKTGNKKMKKRRRMSVNKQQKTGNRTIFSIL